MHTQSHTHTREKPGIRQDRQKIMFHGPTVDHGPTDLFNPRCSPNNNNNNNNQIVYSAIQS